MTKHPDEKLEDASARQRRVRLGLVVLLAGVGFLLVGAGVGVLRGDAPGDEVVVEDGVVTPTAVDRKEQAVAVTVMLVYGLILLLVFVFVAAALVVASRRYHRRLIREPAEPTPADDIWSQHRVPEMDDEESEEDRER